MDDDIAAIRRTITEAQQHQAELEPFLALHTEDTVIVNIAGRRVLGSDGLRAAMKQALDSPLGAVLTRIEVQDIRFAAPDVAIVSCTKHVPADRPGGDGLPARGSLSYVLVREPAGWRIALAQTTPVPA